MTPDQERDVRSAIERGMASFEAAERARDADALVGHFSAASGFYLLRSIEGGFSGLQIHVLVDHYPSSP